MIFAPSTVPGPSPTAGANRRRTSSQGGLCSASATDSHTRNSHCPAHSRPPDAAGSRRTHPFRVLLHDCHFPGFLNEVMTIFLPPLVRVVLLIVALPMRCSTPAARRCRVSAPLPRNICEKCLVFILHLPAEVTTSRKTLWSKYHSSTKRESAQEESFISLRYYPRMRYESLTSNGKSIGGNCFRNGFESHHWTVRFG